MDILDDLIAAGVPEWTVVLADEQTAGVGRDGRRWEAEPGAALLCSILVRPTVPPDAGGMIAIGVGVAVTDYLASLGVETTLKWPNDVLLHDRKLAGILIRTRQDDSGTIANIGIGLNRLPASGGAAGVGVSLSDVMADVPAAATMVRGIVDSLSRTLDRINTYAVRDAWMSSAAYLGGEVIVDAGGRTVAGTLVGIDERGALLLDGIDGEVRRIVSGDLVRGPRPRVAGRAPYT